MLRSSVVALAMMKLFRVVFHLLTCILKRIPETVAVVLRYVVNKPVVKWFVEMYV